MAVNSISKNQKLFDIDQSVSELYLIVKGSCSISFPGGSYTIGKGEVCGICELCTDVHQMSCTALEDSSILVCDVSDVDSLNALFKSNPDYCMLFTRSAFRQISILLQQYEIAQLNSMNLFTGIQKDYLFYKNCCEHHQIKSRSIEEVPELPLSTQDSGLDPWAASYYDGFQQLLSDASMQVLAKECNVPTGLIANICSDSLKILHTLRSVSTYEKDLTHYLLNDELEDLFDMYSALYLKLGADSSDSNTILDNINHLKEMIAESPYLKPSDYEPRFADMNEIISTLPDTSEDAEKKNTQKQAGLALLHDSMQTILEFSGADEEFCTSFKKLIVSYKAENDKNDTNDAPRLLRQNITKKFYELYRLVFFQAVSSSYIPNPVMMFLYFGYIDEQLAGDDNTIYLSHMAEMLADEQNNHIFTLYDWLMAIYTGKREPSRNEFEVDYTDYVHNQKVTSKITAAEEALLMKDMKKKVEYELENMFPVVNKMTFGRISTFCPVFSSHNVLKHLDSSMVSTNRLQTSLDNIINLDFSAFYREYVYANPTIGIQKEFLHTEILPDILLMPCIGTRGVMWQEIEGRKRTTAARMMLPIFYLEDLDSAVARLTGEYRWEMCKRVQGAHWNDVSDRSLTSEYFDYIQFYKKNHELSTESKDKLKVALQKAHNSFKEMFVRDYITYIFFEGAGSPRLNKPARNILFTYCPFAAKVREPLKSNPIYKDTLDYYVMKRSQMMHHMDLLSRKLESLGHSIPKELQDEIKYIEQ